MNAGDTKNHVYVDTLWNLSMKFVHRRMFNYHVLLKPIRTFSNHQLALKSAHLFDLRGYQWFESNVASGSTTIADFCERNTTTMIARILFFLALVVLATEVSFNTDSLA